MISIIICSIDPEKFSRVTKNYADLMGEEPFEIIGIHDARSLTEGYNRGIRQSSGSVLIFSHDDIEIVCTDFVEKLKRHLQQFDVAGPAGTTRLISGCWFEAGIPYIHGQVTHPRDSGVFMVSIYDRGQAALQGQVAVGDIQALDGLFIAARRSVLDRVAFDECIFDGFHGYDVDFTYSAFLAGFRLGVFYDIPIIHASMGKFDEVWEEYNQRFVRKYAAALPDSSALSTSAPHLGATVSCREKDALVLGHTLEGRRQLALKIGAIEKARTESPAPTFRESTSSDSYLLALLKAMAASLLRKSR